MFPACPFIPAMDPAYRHKVCSCGALLLPQKRGRPRTRCKRCNETHRRQYHHDKYLSRKYRGFSKEEIRLLERARQALRDKNEVQGNRHWIRRHCGGRETFEVLYRDDLTWEQKEEKCRLVRDRALKLLQVHENEGRACNEML